MNPHTRTPGPAMNPMYPHLCPHPEHCTGRRCNADCVAEHSISGSFKPPHINTPRETVARVVMETHPVPTKDTNPKDAIGDRKVPLWLLSPIAKAHWALAQFAGMIKYGAWNWRAAGVRTSVYLSAMQRHIDAYTSGETYDPVDGTHHLGNIMACAAILLDAGAAGKLTDDRPPSVGVREVYRFVEAAMADLRQQYADKHPRHYTITDTEEAA